LSFAFYPILPASIPWKVEKDHDEGHSGQLIIISNRTNYEKETKSQNRGNFAKNSRDNRCSQEYGPKKLELIGRWFSQQPSSQYSYDENIDYCNPIQGIPKETDI
jgi:hypothetical protein